jgi:hypothetical protein
VLRASPRHSVAVSGGDANVLQEDCGHGDRLGLFEWWVYTARAFGTDAQYLPNVMGELRWAR